MTDEGRQTRQPAWLDWPVLVIVLGVLLALVGWSSSGRPGILAWLLIAFGVVALLVRLGLFTPRR